MRNGLQRIVWITAAAASLGIAALSWETDSPQQSVQTAGSPAQTTEHHTTTTAPQTTLCTERTTVTETTCGTLFSSAETTQTSPAEAGVYDLNRVTRSELLRIEGMTPENADKILDMRSHIGRFTTMYDLAAIDTLALPYIKRVLFAHLYVEGDTVLGSAHA